MYVSYKSPFDYYNLEVTEYKGKKSRIKILLLLSITYLEHFYNNECDIRSQSVIESEQFFEDNNTKQTKNS
ncbi:hypothetical protein HMPREF0357_11525 [Erysipelothrix rhusiopathiae ATCC 19414]|uniref:Uncharacterized protein n=1 Tax=Erysipelothrix rhusiopathiae ATCC 19414 TaxID=525280 RepID=E7FXZ8_ERYRH|nr:hypothetical protein HMPREF0357_11525 [Erysipelothrix rhusiopathiae ATCC 19414]